MASFSSDFKSGNVLGDFLRIFSQPKTCSCNQHKNLYSCKLAPTKQHSDSQTQSYFHQCWSAELPQLSQKSPWHIMDSRDWFVLIPDNWMGGRSYSPSFLNYYFKYPWEINVKKEKVKRFEPGELPLSKGHWSPVWDEASLKYQTVWRQRFCHRLPEMYIDKNASHHYSKWIELLKCHMQACKPISVRFKELTWHVFTWCLPVVDFYTFHWNSWLWIPHDC